jgi:hypothetical protein
VMQAAEDYNVYAPHRCLGQLADECSHRPLESVCGTRLHSEATPHACGKYAALFARQ